MGEHTITITELDLSRLTALIDSQKGSNLRDKDHLTDLEDELSRADVVASKDVPPNIVTMNSKVRLRDIQSGKTMERTLAYPRDAHSADGTLSIMTPIGTAIIGYAEGDVIEWAVPGGLKHIKIEKILYQPEAAGDYHL